MVGGRACARNLVPKLSTIADGGRVGGHVAGHCRVYFRHFLRHWANDPASFDKVLEEWVDNFMRPGRIAGGFRWYSAANDRRVRAMAGDGPAAEPITVPAYSLWGEHDPILRVAWQESLRDVFTDITLARAPDAGHFVPWESPALTNRAITEFFERLS